MKKCMQKIRQSLKELQEFLDHESPWDYIHTAALFSDLPKVETAVQIVVADYKEIIHEVVDENDSFVD